MKKKQGLENSCLNRKTKKKHSMLRARQMRQRNIRTETSRVEKA